MSDQTTLSEQLEQEWDEANYTNYEDVKVQIQLAQLQMLEKACTFLDLIALRLFQLSKGTEK